MGAIIPTTKQLRDQEWQNLRRQTLSKFSESKKTGAAGSTLTTLDNIIMDIVGRDSVKVNALNIEDMPVVFNQIAAQRNEVTEDFLFEVVVDNVANTGEGPAISGNPNPVDTQEGGSSLVSTGTGICDVTYLLIGVWILESKKPTKSCLP